jgi:hypothetical protein
MVRPKWLGRFSQKGFAGAKMTEGEVRLLKLIQLGVLSVDDNGQIWRLAQRRRGTDVFDPIVPRLAESQSTKGYLVVQLTERPNKYTVFAHRLVWMHFFGPIPDKMEINHKNGIKSDNRPSNLEVLTGARNKEHARQIGLMPAITSAKLDERQVLGIRADFATGAYSQRELARRHSVSPQTINNIVRGISWTNIP